MQKDYFTSMSVNQAITSVGAMATALKHSQPCTVHICHFEKALKITRNYSFMAEEWS